MTLDDVLVTILGEDPLVRPGVPVEVIGDQDEVALLEPEQLHGVRRLRELLDLPVWHPTEFDPSQLGGLGVPLAVR